MATIFLTNGNDSRLLDRPGTYVVDGLAGRDTMEFGTSASTDYEITLGADGGVHVDSLSGASQQFHGTFYNFEVFVFRNRSERIELATYFSASQPPTVTITDFTSGTAIGPVSYDLAFSKPVTGLAADDFQVSGGSVIAVAGSSSGYTVTVQPTAGSEGSISFTLKAGAVQDAAGLTNADTSAAAQPYDTLAPRVAAGSPTVGATGVSTSGPIVIDFSEPVHGGTGTVVLRDSAGTQLGFWSSSDVGALLSGTRLTLTLAPGRTLPAAATLRVELGAAVVQDTAGNAFAASSFTFTTAGVVTQTGGAGNDVFTLTRGPYAVDGAGGIDQAVVAGARSVYTLAPAGSGYTLASADLTASLSNVERVGFGDQKLALDMTGNAGLVARTLGAVFGRASVNDAVYAGIGLQLVDGGTGYTALMQLALDAKLGAGASHAAVVDLLYTNVVGSAPSAEARAFYVALLDNGTYTPAILGTIAADTELNLANIDLVGLTQHGLVYI